ncbi:MAG: hypothetical protein ACLGHT_04345 [Acidimicrobiia bacterium]
MAEEVRLAMPANPEYLRLARVTAMGIASRLGFTFDEIEDLRIAIDELCFAIMGNRDHEGFVELRYALDGDCIEVSGVGHFSDSTGIPGLSELSELIVSAVSEEHEVDVTGGEPTFRLVKRRTGELTT